MYSNPAIVDKHIAALKGGRGDIAVAACVAEINKSTPSEIQLLPAGEFRARDGRPGNGLSWYVDARIAAGIIADAAKLRGDLVIDYEHQTLLAEQNGKPAPAAGWFSGSKLEWRDGQGLFATDVQWTAPAKAAIDAGEYRYISPVILFNPRTGAVSGIQMAALTNFPAIEGLSDLMARAAAKFSHATHEEEDTVKREDLIKLLGLAADATDEQISAGMAALKAKADQVESLATEVAALKTKTPDPAQYAPIKLVSDLQEQVAALSAKQIHGEVEDVISQAQDAGKLLPAMVDWARDLGKKDLAALKAYVEKAPVVAALKGNQTRGQAPAGSGGELGEVELAVCRQLGVTPEAYKKTLGAHAA